MQLFFFIIGISRLLSIIIINVGPFYTSYQKLRVKVKRPERPAKSYKKVQEERRKERLNRKSYHLPFKNVTELERQSSTLNLGPGTMKDS